MRRESASGPRQAGYAERVSRASFERDLRLLEDALRRLNAEYDGFLYGSAAKPPFQTGRPSRRWSAA